MRGTFQNLTKPRSIVSMSPKFKGGSDDWLDDESESGQGRGTARKPKSGAPARASALSPEEANATVTEVFPNQCRVWFDEAGSEKGAELLCAYRRAGVIGASKADVRARAPVAVGDRVKAKRVGDTGVVEGVSTRRNALSRPAPGREEKNLFHVIAANVDALAIVASARQPDFSTGLVDRYLIAAGAAGIPALLCVSKVDLVASGDVKPWDTYRRIGYPVFEFSSKTKVGIEELKNSVLGREIVFCGHSGVGKTSLLRVLTGSEVGRVGDINQMTSKGRHTTTSAVMLGGPDRSRWIDTPGVREFGLAHVTLENLAQFFPEMKGLACEQPKCLHEDEPGCAASTLDRYASYRRILQSLREGEN